MQAPEYHLLRMVEDHHWWHSVLHRQVMDVFSAGFPPRGYLLDAGCGTGGMLASLRKRHPLLETEGVDASDLAVDHCRQRGLKRVRQGTVHDLPFENGTFDAVLSLDVLSHVNVEERAAVAEMTRVLRPGGLLVANAPAFDCLRGAHDAAVCGTRRFKVPQLRRLFENEGLRCERLHYWNAWLFLPLLVWRRLSRRPALKRELAPSDLVPPPAWLNRFLAFGGGLDARLCRWLRIPMGSSVFAVARKPSGQAGGRPA